MNLALWAVNLSTRLPDLESWLALVEKQVKLAAAVEMDMLVLPEYACMQWLYWKPENIAPAKELRWLAEQVPAALSGLWKLVYEYDIAILAGTMPVTEGVLIKNRAFLLTPDSYMHQDKLHPTPTERDRAGWFVTEGMGGLRTIDYRGYRIAVVICHDAQSVRVFEDLQRLKPNLVLIPSMTEREEGAMGRKAIFDAAAAIARDLPCAVAVVGAIGTQDLIDRKEPNVGGAAIYIGRRVIDQIGPFDEFKQPWGPTLHGGVFHMQPDLAAA